MQSEQKSASRESTRTEKGAAVAERKRQRTTAIAVACVVVALPVSYLISYYGRPMPAASDAASISGTTAIAALEQTARLNPSADNRINLSLAYIQANQPARAIPFLESVVAEDANNAVAWNNLCVAHTLQMDYNVALGDCGQALRVRPDFQLARNNRDWAQQEFIKAQNEIARAQQTAPAARDAALYLEEGLNLLHIGRYDDAIGAWQHAMALDPHSALAANNLGIAYMLKKQPVVAVGWFEKAHALDPSLQIAINNLAWARSVAGSAAPAQ